MEVATVSNQAITWALDVKTPGPATKVLLIALANYANEHGESYPSIARMADETDQSQASVKRHLKTLEAMGLIVRSMRGNEDGGRATNRYKLVIPAKVRAQIELGGVAQSDPPLRAQSEPIAGVRAQSEPGFGLNLGGSKGSPVSPEPKDKEKNMSELRPDVVRICEHLANRIEENGSKRPEITKVWLREARLLIDKDGRAEDKIHTAIDWSQDSDFWRANILSMPKLRAKYDQLRLQWMRDAKEKKAAAAAEAANDTSNWMNR